MAIPTTNPQSPKMLTVTEAVQVAKKYLWEVYHVGGTDARVEEVDLTEDEKYWYITLSYNSPDFPVKELKVFKIGAKDGKMWSMQIRMPRK